MCLVGSFSPIAVSKSTMPKENSMSNFHLLKLELVRISLTTLMLFSKKETI